MASKKRSISSLHSAAQTLGSAGGKQGGPARARALSSPQRSEIAREGGKAASKSKKAKSRKS